MGAGRVRLTNWSGSPLPFDHEIRLLTWYSLTIDRFGRSVEGNREVGERGHLAGGDSRRVPRHVYVPGADHPDQTDQTGAKIERVNVDNGEDADSGAHDQRVDALEDLLLLRLSPIEAQQGLRAFAWDSEVLVTLTRHHLVRVLDQYLDERLSAAAVELWAEVVEGRDDIALESGYEDLLKETIFQLATTVINTELSPSKAQELRLRLML